MEDQPAFNVTVKKVCPAAPRPKKVKPSIMVPGYEPDCKRKLVMKD